MLQIDGHYDLPDDEENDDSSDSDEGVINAYLQFNESCITQTITTTTGFPQGGVCSAKFWIIAFDEVIEIINQREWNRFCRRLCCSIRQEQLTSTDEQNTISGH